MVFEKRLSVNEIWIICDLQSELEYSLELIGKGREIADFYQKNLVVLEFMDKSEARLNDYIQAGGDFVLYYGSSVLSMHSVKETCKDLFTQYTPFLTMGCCTGENKEMMSCLAVQLEAGLTADCVDITCDEGTKEIIFSRTALNASTMANIICVNSAIRMCSVKKGVFLAPCQKKIKREGQVLHMELQEAQKEKQEEKSCLLFEKEIDEIEKTVKIKSKIVVGVGRGALSSLETIKKFAERINADIGATRALVDMGVFEREQQIGQSGNSIIANTYIAFGVSGAAQHIVGLKNVGKIIAVNKDKHAAIFRVSDMAVVGDVEVISKKLLKYVEG